MDKISCAIENIEDRDFKETWQNTNKMTQTLSDREYHCVLEKT